LTYRWRVLMIGLGDAAFSLPKQVHHRQRQVYGRNPVDEQRKTLIRRRDLLLAVTVSGAVVATGTAASPTPTELRRDKRKPQYQANSPEVQTFYRVNRYPVK
jgi:hypothetical protein